MDYDDNCYWKLSENITKFIIKTLYDVSVGEICCKCRVVTEWGHTILQELFRPCEASTTYSTVHSIWGTEQPNIHNSIGGM